MDNELLIGLVIEYLEGMDKESIKRVNIHQTGETNGYEGLTIDIVYQEPNKTDQAEDKQDADFYG